jgi:hypothetical protein
MVYECGGGGPDRTRIVCCFMGCDEYPFNPLLAALPAVMHLSAADPNAATSWLGTLLSMAANESRSARPGSENILARAAELMFVETIRRHLETLPSSQAGWLAGLRDPVVGRALAALHGEPSESWTGGPAGARGWGVTLGSRGALYGDGGPPSDRVSGVVADAARIPPAHRWGAGGLSGDGGRL